MAPLDHMDGDGGVMMQRDDVRSCVRFWSVTTGYGRKEKKYLEACLALPCRRAVWMDRCASFIPY